MAHDRDVAGIRCMQVLTLLSDYVDGELADATKRQIDAHLAGCDWCERFGGAFAGMVGAVRAQLPDDALGAARARLEEALDRGQ